MRSAAFSPIIMQARFGLPLGRAGMQRVPVARAGLEQQDRHRRILAEARGNHRTGRARSHHDPDPTTT